MAIQSIRGMHDLFGEEIRRWQPVEKHIAQIFADFGYQEIRTPVMESVEVFTQAVGEATDIVEKQMYVIERDRETVALRPEGTAAFMRAIIQHQLHRQPQPQRYFYYLPMFRYERPQKGRLRQFHQFGAEFINDPSPEADAEVIALLDHIYRSLGLTQYEIRINTIGTTETRALYRKALENYFAPHVSKMDPEAQSRFQRAPMRLLDSKDPALAPLIEKAPLITEHLTPGDRAHYEAMKKALKHLGVKFDEDPRIVRGLDYYCHTAFEFVSDLLGAQSALVGGGRYDGLAERFGEKPIPAVGFGLGMERLLMALEAIGKLPTGLDKPFYFFAPLGEKAYEVLYPLSVELKKNGIWTEMLYEKDKALKGQLKQANRLQARNAVILGDEEMAKGKVLIKDMEKGTQDEVALSGLSEHLLKRAKANE